MEKKYAVEFLKERYLNSLKEDPTLFIGVELEFPIVSKKQEATNIEVCKSLFVHLISDLGFEIEKYDDDNFPIQLFSKVNEDRILFEVSYTTIEIAFGKVEHIQEVDMRFQRYLSVIQSYLDRYDHEIVGIGVNPNWDKNDNSPVKTDRYRMLMSYLALSEKEGYKQCHHYPQYGAFICGNQVQLDVSRSDYIKVINLFNAIEPVKAYLFANSRFTDSSWNTSISRDLFWEKSMHGLFEENVGVNSREFQSEEDFFDYLSNSALFTVQREGEIYYFPPVKVKDYMSCASITAYNLQGETQVIFPMINDLEHHRSYQYQDLTTRGTIEFRSVCAQKFSETFSVAAFHLGLLTNLDAFENIIKSNRFYAVLGRDYKFLRKKFSGIDISDEDEQLVNDFARILLDCAYEGLSRRKWEEEKYLIPLYEKLS